MKEYMLVLPDAGAAPEVLGLVKHVGGKVVQRYGKCVLVVSLGAEDNALKQKVPHGVKAYGGIVPDRLIPADDESAKIGVMAWNTRHGHDYAIRKAKRPGQGLSWGNPGFEPEGSSE